jgi:hypothetical protein
MDYIFFVQYFSSSRMERYLLASGNDEKKAIELYRANLQVSKAFHPLIGIFEVILRNRLNDVLGDHFADANWILNQRTGFMVDSSLGYTHKRSGEFRNNDFLKREVDKVEKRLIKAGKPVVAGAVLSEQTLGFWTDLFEVHHYRLLRGKPIQIFSALPPGYGRKEVSAALDTIRRFRNRVFHHEPICFKGYSTSFEQALVVYESVRSVLRWIHPQILEMLVEVDEVYSIVQKSAFRGVGTAFY